MLLNYCVNVRSLVNDMFVISKKSFLIILLSTIVSFTILFTCYRTYYDIVPISKFNNVYVKHILIWNNPKSQPINNFKIGLDTFIERQCPNSNCFVVYDRNYFQSVTDFDVIIFHGPEISVHDLPLYRSPHQLYVFASMESSHYYRICPSIFNDFFNLTFTYKLDSDIYYGYIAIQNSKGITIGPKVDMEWMKVEDMQPTNECVKNILKKKEFAAAWFVSNCETPGKREIIAKKLKAELKKYNLVLHIYGKCGDRICPKQNSEICLKVLENNYYFYLSFENSLSIDYVTEKLLTALQHYAVPVVYGGANYSRFLPDGTYLDANKLTVEELAKEMMELINDTNKYYDYFKWHNHYSYHDYDSLETNSYCDFCSVLNGVNQFKETRTHPDFTEWWSQNYCKKPLIFEY